MKTKIITFALFATFLSWTSFAQDRTTVTATGSDISDNLDLTAVASIFGDSQNLEDFEQRLNDPKIQISNLDLNGDNQVDYLRVIESVEGRTHLIIIQSVLDRDVYQDVATIEVERDNNNRVQVQVVGNVYMYGQNYIYEPVYVNTPVIYSNFWGNNYNPYVSAWYWNYYPTYYYGWTPYPVYRYRRNVHVHINVHNHYNYVNNRRSTTAVALYNGRRNNGYERQYPNRSFERRNANVSNRYELDQTRRTAAVSTRNTTSNQTRNTTRNNSSLNENATTRANTSVRTNNAVRTNTATRNNPVNTNTAVRTQNAAIRTNTQSNAAARNNEQSVRSQQQSATRANTNTSTRANTNATRSNTPANIPSRAASIPQQAQRQQQAQRPQQSAARSNPAPAANRAQSENINNSSSRR